MLREPTITVIEAPKPRGRERLSLPAFAARLGLIVIASSAVVVPAVEIFAHVLATEAPKHMGPVIEKAIDEKVPAYLNNAGDQVGQQVSATVHHDVGEVGADLKEQVNQSTQDIKERLEAAGKQAAGR